MLYLDIVILSLIQGITEFLPISSSGHLVLYPLLSGRPDQGITMDVAVHFGTLIAVCLYFRGETAALIQGSLDLIRLRVATENARLTFLVAIASVPAVACGLALKLAELDQGLRTVEIIGWATLLGGALLYLADRFAPRRATDGAGQPRPWRFGDAVMMGLAQAIALIPGTSRSGITMTAARGLGFEREEAARLSLVMAIPLIFAATVLEIAGLLTAETSGAAGAATGAAIGAGGQSAGDHQTSALTVLALAAMLSCLAALAALRVMFGMFRRAWTMTPFVIYRMALGLGLLALAYG